MDGGRVLRAAIWGLTGNHRKATRVAARGGQVLGATAVILGIVIGLKLEPINGIWIGIAGGFLFSVATAGLRDAKSGNDAPEIEGAAQPQDA